MQIRTHIDHINNHHNRINSKHENTRHNGTLNKTHTQHIYTYLKQKSYSSSSPAGLEERLPFESVTKQSQNKKFKNRNKRLEITNKQEMLTEIRQIYHVSRVNKPDCSSWGCSSLFWLRCTEELLLFWFVLSSSEPAGLFTERFCAGIVCVSIVTVA